MSFFMWQLFLNSFSVDNDVSCRDGDGDDGRADDGECGGGGDDGECGGGGGAEDDECGGGGGCGAEDCECGDCGGGIRGITLINHTGHSGVTRGFKGQL